LSYEPPDRHRDPHSSPTRRSSDLAQYGDGGLGGEAVTAGGRIEGPPDLCLLITAVLEPETDVADDPRTAVIRRQRSGGPSIRPRSEEHTSELQSRFDLVCRLLLEK